MALEVVTIKDLHFAYPGEKDEILRGVNLTLEEGKFYILCGKSGCGKSTLLRHMKSALMPKGTMRGSLHRGVPEEEIGFVFQHPDYQIVTDQVWHELVFGMENLGLSQDVMHLRVAELAAYFGIERWFDREVSRLSGGQKQLLNLAAVLTLRPKLLLLDEPMAWLDPMAAGEFLHTLYRIQREMGMTVLLSAHQLEEVISYGDELLYMEEGRIVGQGSPEYIGRELRHRGAGFYMAMPVPMRIYLQSRSSKRCPCTIAQGREWLRQELEGQGEFALNGEETHRIEMITEENKRPLPILKVRNLRFRYPGGDRDVLCDTSFEAGQGEILAILGGNGSGKSTLLRTMSGLLPARGGKVLLQNGRKWVDVRKVPIEGRMALLPQDATSIFQEETVERELAGNCQERRRWIERFHLDGILARHPYDISGGEQQKVALVKILIKKPSIILLDEPTKGMDAMDKGLVGEILEALAGEGKTVLMVSHDLEFAASYAHRAGIFFRGRLEGLLPARDFFCQNHFYTTAAQRMSRESIPWAVTAEDVLAVLPGNNGDAEICGERKAPLVRDAEGYGGMSEIGNARYSGTREEAEEGRYSDGAEEIEEGGCPDGNEESKDSRYSDEAERWAESRRISPMRGRMASYIAGIFVLYPALLWLGMTFFHDRRYLLISLGMVIYALLPFFRIWERKPPKVQKLVVVAVLAAIAVAGRCAFYMFPSMKPMAAVAIVAGISLGAESGFLVGAMSMLASNMMFGQGPWTPWQMLAMGLVGLFAGLLMHGERFGKAALGVRRISMAVYGLIGVLCFYGGIMNPASLLMGSYEVNRQNLLAIYLSGLPMDLVHGGTTAALLLVAGIPMLKILERMKKKYDLEEGNE